MRQKLFVGRGGGLVCAAPEAANGYVKPDATLLAAEMEALIADPTRRRALGLAGRKAFLEGGFTWASIVDDYERILLGHAPPAAIEG